jgi:hypothetical protein
MVIQTHLRLTFSRFSSSSSWLVHWMQKLFSRATRSESTCSTVLNGYFILLGFLILSKNPYLTRPRKINRHCSFGPLRCGGRDGGTTTWYQVPVLYRTMICNRVPPSSARWCGPVDLVELVYFTSYGLRTLTSSLRPSIKNPNSKSCIFCSFFIILTILFSKQRTKSTFRLSAVRPCPLLRTLPLPKF